MTRLRDTLQTKNTHKCYAGLCRPEWWNQHFGDSSPECCCRKGFPCAANFGATYEDPIARRWVMYRPGAEFMWISTTTAATAVTWGGHTNVQPLTTDAFTDYMLKYEMKADPTGACASIRPGSRASNFTPPRLGMLTLDCDVEKALGITNLTEHQKSLISAVTLQKPVSISDAAWNLLEFELVSKSHAVLHVNTRPTARLTTAAWATRAGELRTTSASVPPIRVYESRPPVAELEGLTIYEMFTGFEVKDKKTIRGRQLVGSSGNMHWFRVKPDKAHVVTFWDPFPGKDPQAFFYVVLLRNVVFRNETELTRPGETYLDACRRLPARNGVERAINDRDQLLKALDEYWVSTHPSDCAEELADKMLDTLGLDHELRVIGGPSADAMAAVAAATDAVHAAALARGEDPALALAAADVERRRLLSADVASELTEELDALRARGALDDFYVPFEPKQRELVLRVTAPGATGLIWLDGGPGTGKSLATKCAIHILRQRALLDNEPDSGVHITASSAKAARRLSRVAKTTHTGFFIPTKGPILAANGAHEWYMAARRARVFFLEEYSMLSTPHGV